MSNVKSLLQWKLEVEVMNSDSCSKTKLNYLPGKTWSEEKQKNCDQVFLVIQLIKSQCFIGFITSTSAIK